LSVNDVGIDIQRLTESIKHRGPDSTKYFLGPRVVCGFNRLAIVDNDARSDQPMVDPSGRYLLTFNGEIYNHNELRSRLATRHHLGFVTRSDTEVLLKGLISEGAEFVSKLDGIFAFAFVDLATLEVLLARDVFGVKPLYYYSQGDRLYVSSEVRPLWQLSGGKLRLSNIARYLSYGIVGNGEAIVSGVNEVQPNSVTMVRPGRTITTARIHDFVHDVRDSVDLEELGEVLYQTIDSQKPEIPYGILFSGGLDSTFILNRCVEDNHLSGAYSVDVDHAEMSERRWQEYVLDVLDLKRKYRKVELRKEHLSVENIAKISEGLDYPLFHPNFIGSFWLTRMAAEDGLKVLISGEGADELFLGYRWFFSNQPVSSFLEYVPLQDIQTLLQGPMTTPMRTSGMNLLQIFQKIYLQRWLLRQDLTGMANSIEIRVPFLGLNLARLVNELSTEFKRGNGQGKWPIKKLLSKTFPKEFLERKKVGFDFPLNEWIGDEHIDFLRRQTDLIDTKTLNSIIHKHEGSHMKNRIIFSLVSLSLWHESMENAGRRRNDQAAATVPPITLHRK
jgi:asparagine synthase (glutamine-hydrolysing)